MAGETDYTTPAAVKADLGLGDAADDARISDAITAASRWVDDYCGTTFYPVVEQRVFVADAAGHVWVDRFTSTVGLQVATGTDGTYGNVLAPADAAAFPYNAPGAGRAYDRIVAYGGARFPSSFDGRPTVAVTASWGWDHVPDVVERATRLVAQQMFRWADAPEGIAGTNEFGVVRVPRTVDARVLALLAPYAPPSIA